jgi:hypothetical protein
MCPQGAIWANLGGASKQIGQRGARPRSLRSTASTTAEEGGNRSGRSRTAALGVIAVGVAEAEKVVVVLGVLLLLLLLPLGESILEISIRDDITASLSSIANGLESRTTNLKLIK